MDSQVSGPAGPVPQPLVPTTAQGKQPVAIPSQDKQVTIVNGQMVIRQTQASGTLDR